MKTAEEFRKEVYEKQGAAVAARQKRYRRSALCVSLALVVTVCGVGVPRLLRQQNSDVLRPRLLQVGSPKNPVESAGGETDEAFVKELQAAIDAENQEKIEALKAQFRQKVQEQAVIEPWFSDSVNGLASSVAAYSEESETKNDCFSPLSLYYDLALLSAGAQGRTESELLWLLGRRYEEGSAGLAEQCGQYYAQHYRDQEDSVFRLENSLWLDSAHTYSDAFIQSAEENFFASLFLVDFTDPTVAGDMTNWVAEQTNGLLSPSFEFDEFHKASILNSLYYKNTWATPFNPQQTETGKFTTKSGVVDAEFMHRTFTTEVCQIIGNVKCFSLPLSEGDEMVIFFPDNPNTDVSVNTVFHSANWLRTYLNWELYSNDPDSYRTTLASVDLKIPKFTVKQEHDLIDVLPSIARSEIGADFSGMGNVDLFVSKLQHDVSFSIDENGIEAAAGTMTGLSGKSDGPVERMEINLNRPFAFAVLTNDKTTDPDVTKKTVVYYGVCGDPSQN